MGKFLKFSLVVFSLLFISCSKKEEVEQIDPRVQKAFGLIEKGSFPEAERIIREVRKENPNDCYAAWGTFFIAIKRIMDVINSVISLFSGFGQLGISPRIDFSSDFREKNLSDIISLAILPILSPTEDISQSVAVIDAKKCYVSVSLPLVIGSKSSPISSSRLGELKGERKVWGPTEAALLGSVANILSGIFKFLLVINFDINISKLIDLQFKVDLSSLISFGSSPAPQDILRDLSSQQLSFLTSALSFNVYDTAIFFASLAYILEVSPDFLKLKPGSEANLDEIASQLSLGFYLFNQFLKYISIYSNEKTIIGYKDIGKRGLSADDDIFLNIYNEEGEQGFFVKLGNLDLKLDGILSSLILKPIVNPELNKKVSDFSYIFSRALDINNPNIKEEERWIDLSLLSYVLPLIEIPSVIKFSPKNFIEGLKKTPEGLRAILPIWSDLNNDGFPEFLIEAESRNLEHRFCFRKEDRTRKFVVYPPYIVLGDLSPGKKRVRIITTRGTVNTDFSCYVRHDIQNVAGNFSFYIDSSINVNNLQISAQSVEMRFDVFDCSSYDTQVEKYFVCYRSDQGGLISGSSNRPYVYIENSFYPIEKVFSDQKLLDIFQRKLITSYTQSVSPQESVEGNCQHKSWVKQKSFKGEDTFSMIICPLRNYSLSNTYFSAQANFEIYSCFYEFNNLYFVFPFRISDENLVGVTPDILLTRGLLSTDDMKILSVGRYIQDGEKAKNYITENISVVRSAQRYRVFSLFFTDPDVLRVNTLRDFPMNSFIVLGCSTVLPRCFYAQDSPHFPSRVISQGIVINPNIKNDCMFPDGDWSYYYLAFRDPTFFNSVRVNVANIAMMCQNDPQDWVEPDQYLMNKVFAYILQRTLSPIISVVARIIGIITGTYQDISQGEYCN